MWNKPITKQAPPEKPGSLFIGDKCFSGSATRTTSLRNTVIYGVMTILYVNAYCRFKTFNYCQLKVNAPLLVCTVNSKGLHCVKPLLLGVENDRL